MRCKDFRILINEYVDGEITREDEIKLFRHLATCELCQLYLRDLRGVKKGVRAVNVPFPDEGLDYVVLSKTRFRRIKPISSIFKSLGFHIFNGIFRENLRDMIIGFPMAVVIFLFIFSLLSPLPVALENVVRQRYVVNSRSEEINKMIYNILYLENTYQFTPEGLSLDDVYIPRLSSIPLKNFAEKHIEDSEIDRIELIVTVTKDGDAHIDRILELKNPELKRDLIKTLNCSLALPAISDGRKINSKIAIRFEKVVVTG